jgi:hypothetical protein
MAGTTILLFSVGVHVYQISPRETFEYQESFPKGILLGGAQLASSDTSCGSFPSPDNMRFKHILKIFVRHSSIGIPSFSSFFSSDINEIFHTNSFDRESLKQSS